MSDEDRSPVGAGQSPSITVGDGRINWRWEKIQFGAKDSILTTLTLHVCAVIIASRDFGEFWVVNPLKKSYLQSRAITELCSHEENHPLLHVSLID